MSEATSRISAMLKEAESSPKIRALSVDFDRDPWLLNVQNGTIDLRTGQLRVPRREDLITRVIPIDYDPDARSELWDRFIAEQIPDQELAAFIRLAAGYTLTGSTQEDAIFLAHGEGGTGKTTLVETIKEAMGPYAGSVRIEALTSAGRSPGGHSEDIAALAGLRMVTAVEASEDERLREGLVKHLTGGDTLRASLKHKPSFEFRPNFKLWMATNEAPYVRSDDSGAWRRLHKLPFTSKRKKSDVKDQLKRPDTCEPFSLGPFVDASSGRPTASSRRRPLSRAPRLCESAWTAASSSSSKAAPSSTAAGTGRRPVTSAPSTTGGRRRSRCRLADASTRTGWL